jgi:hypothetical protein
MFFQTKFEPTSEIIRGTVCVAYGQEPEKQSVPNLRWIAFSHGVQATSMTVTCHGHKDLPEDQCGQIVSRIRPLTLQKVSALGRPDKDSAGNAKFIEVLTIQFHRPALEEQIQLCILQLVSLGQFATGGGM